MEDLKNLSRNKKIAIGVAVAVVVAMIILIVVLTTAPKADVPEPPKGPTFIFHSGKDSYGGDIGYESELANNVRGLKALCGGDDNCKGFNTAGWIKHTILPEDDWIVWRDDQEDQGLYVKDQEHMFDARSFVLNI